MKRALVVMALLAVAAVAGAFLYESAARARDYRQLLALGDAALAELQTSEAIEDYSGAIALRPDSMLAHLRRAETYVLRADLEAAARDFRTAASLDPSATRPLEQWGDVLYRQQRYRRAAEVYESRLRLDDRSATIWYRLGLARYREGNSGAALSNLERAVQLDGQMADAFYMLGVCLRDAHREDAAVAALRNAVDGAPGLIPAREELADLYGLLGKHNDEIEQLQVLAGLDSGRIERRVAVGMAQARAGHTDLAVLTLASALDKAADQPAIYGALGRMWLDIAETHPGRSEALGKALEVLERGASAASATSEMKTLYGRALLRDHQPEAAERMLQQATERYPAEPAAFALYADVAEQQRHLDAARAALVAYSALVSDDKGSEGIAARIGVLSLRLNDPVAAVHWLEIALMGAPLDVQTIAALAEAQLKTGNRDGARAALVRGIQVEPNNPQLLALSRRLS